MSGFILDDETVDQIYKQLPDIETLARTVFKFSPDFVSMKCPVNSNIPVAAVCLQDMVNTLLSVRMALYEYHAHRIWYRERSDPINEPFATVMMRYYIDDAAARLYASSEHLANAIICMLDIDDSQLEPYRKNRTSQQSIVGHYLAKKLPKETVTHDVLTLAKSDHWAKTIDYRNEWVHAQPPSIKGLGLIYKRKKRWVSKDEGNGKVTHTLSLGGGDSAEFSVDELMGFIQSATFEFEKVCVEVAAFYTKILEKHGIVITDTGIEFKIFERKTPQ